MKTYIVKVTATCMENTPYDKIGDVKVFIIDKGYVFDERHLSFISKSCGWKRKHFAESYIKKDMEWKNKHPSHWKHAYEILEFDV